MGGNALDPNLASHKAERFIKVVSDTLTTSSDQAAADPDNLKGKSSDNKPDGVEVSLAGRHPGPVCGCSALHHRLKAGAGWCCTTCTAPHTFPSVPFRLPATG